MKKNMYNGFSLAEVLVTLTIIGVISAMTIPGLKKVADERANVAKVQKAYATISNATKAIQTTEGGVRFWGWTTRFPAIIHNNYLPKLNIAKDCSVLGGCFPSDYNFRYLNGEEGFGRDWTGASGWYTFITADGVYWAARVGDSSCNQDIGVSAKKACAFFEVDVNGPNEPNMVGLDVFGFYVSADGTVYPLGGCPECTAVCSGDSDGWGCTAKLLREGKISW